VGLFRGELAVGGYRPLGFRLRLPVSTLLHVDAPLVGHAPGPLTAVAGVFAVHSRYRYTLLYTATWSSVPLPGGAWRGAAPYVPLMSDDQRPVDPARPVYVWKQVADHIAARIASGELAPGARLEGERELAEALGVAVGTVRRAVEDLRERGLVVTLPAKGTYIAEP
jgi:GntR family transcriptional regulator